MLRPPPPLSAPRRDRQDEAWLTSLASTAAHPQSFTPPSVTWRPGTPTSHSTPMRVHAAVGEVGSRRGARSTALTSPPRTYPTRSSTFSAATAAGAATSSSPLSLYLQRKALYNLEADDDEENEEDVSYATDTPHQPARAEAALMTHTPIRSLQPSPHRSQPQHQDPNKMQTCSRVADTTVPPIPASSCVVPGTSPRASPTHAAAMEEWTFARQLESDVAPYMARATNAILDALVSVEEGDDVPRVLSEAIENQIAILTRHVCVRAVAAARHRHDVSLLQDIPPHTQSSLAHAPAAANTPDVTMTTTTTTGAPPTQGVVSVEEVRALREELHALRALVTPATTATDPAATAQAPAKPSKPPASSGTRRTDARMLPPERQAPPRPQLSSSSSSSSSTTEPRARTAAAPQYEPRRVPPQADARHTRQHATPHWVEPVSAHWTSEEEEVWRTAQRILNESGV